MTDVVGTAYVRIKALTDQLAKDIKKDVTKALKDADLDKAGKAGGAELGESLGNETADSASKTLKKRSKDIVPGDDIVGNFDEITKNIQAQFEELDFGAPFREKFERSARIDRLNIRQMFDPIREEMRELGDAFDINDLPFFTETEGRFRRLANDIKSNDEALDKFQSKLRGLGRGGNLPQLGFLGKSVGLIGGAIVAALPYIQDVGAAVLAYATGLVAQVGFLTTALAGLGAAAGAAIGAAGAAALPLLLAFKSETELLVDFKDSMAAAGEEFLRIGTATQQTLLPALDDAVFVLGDLVPMFSEFGLFVGQLAGTYARYAAEVLVSETAQGRLSDILQSSLRILDRLFPSLINVGNILSGIWVAALPSAERFVDLIGDMVDRWSGMVTKGLASGELTRTIDLWYDRAVLLGSALGDVAGALFDILEVGGDSADDVFVRFDQWAERFRTFTESEAGKNRLALIFENSLAVMREINAIAADLFDGIFGRLGEIGGVDSMVAALRRFRDVIPEIQEFWADAYATIKSVVEILAANVWEKVTVAWEQMSEPLGRLVTQMLALLDVMNESGAFEIFLDLMEILADVLSTLLAIPGFGTFIAYFIAFNSALKVGGLVLSPFLKLFGSFGSLLINLVRGATGAQVGGLAGMLTKLATSIKGMATAGAASTAGDFTKLGAEAGGATGGVGNLAAVLGGAGGGSLLVAAGVAGASLAVLGKAFYDSQQRSQRWKQEIRQVTEVLGTVNDGLNITTKGVAEYVETFSSFESNNQLDDLKRLSLTFEEIAEGAITGSLSYQDFANKALKTGEVVIKANGGISGSLDPTIDSLSELGDEVGLTYDQLTELAKGGAVYAQGTQFVLEGNDDLLDSFKEVNEVIGAAAKDSIDAFVANATNIELLGRGELASIKKQIDDASDEEAGTIMVQAQNDVAAAARNASLDITGLTEATRLQITEQARLADGTVDPIRQYELLRDALAKQNEEIRTNLAIFASADFEKNFGGAKAAVLNFSELVENTDFSPLYMGIGDNVDALTDKFPRLGESALLLFDQLKDLPEEQFNAAAEAMGVDADTLRTSMEGAMGAIKDLQDQAVASLPTVGELLDEATSIKEDGTQAFDRDGFVKSINERVTDTERFGDNIARIQRDIGDEAARLAVEQGPEAAQNLVDMIGHGEQGLNTALQAMEESERQLKIQIAEVLGPGIAAQYSVTGGVVGDAWGGGVASGLNSVETMEALKTASLDVLNQLARGFQGHFVIDNNVLKFVYTGSFNIRKRPNLLDRGLFAEGGLVPGSVKETFTRSFGTDTIPAMLTPGEYVNTRATVDRLGVGFFRALDRGATPAVPVGGGGIDASGWTIVSPDPYESSQQIIARLRTASFMLGDA